MYLLQHRDNKAGIFYPDYWGFFGGAIETSEKPIEAANRELFEETELNLSMSFVGKLNKG